MLYRKNKQNMRLDIDKLLPPMQYNVINIDVFAPKLILSCITYQIQIFFLRELVATNLYTFPSFVFELSLLFIKN